MGTALYILWLIIWIPISLLMTKSYIIDIIKEVKKRNYSGIKKPLFYIIFFVSMTYAGLSYGLSKGFNNILECFHWIYENGIQILFYAIWTPLSLWITYFIIIDMIENIKNRNYTDIFAGLYGFIFFTVMFTSGLFIGPSEYFDIIKNIILEDVPKVIVGFIILSIIGLLFGVNIFKDDESKEKKGE
jgi:hypothetical protein